MVLRIKFYLWIHFLRAYDLFPLKRRWEKLVSRLFVYHFASILLRLFDLTNVSVCVCVFVYVGVIFAEFMAIGIRLHANYISLFCHSSPFSGWNVHEFHMLNCYQVPKKRTPKIRAVVAEFGLDTMTMMMMEKKERRATITSFPRGHYEIVQSNFTWPTINFVTKYHLFCGRAAEWVSKHFNERADKHCDAIVKLLTLTYASVVATLLILLYVTMYVENTLVALDYMKHFIYLTHRTRFVWVVFSLTSQPN